MAIRRLTLPARFRRAARAPQHPHLPDNYPAHVFRSLYGAWNRDAADERVDQLAAELTACAAAAGGPLCLGLLRREAVPHYYGLVYLLDGYGLVLRKRYRQDGRGVFVFLDRKGDAPCEHVGSQVHERPLPATLPQAA